jgi:zinc transport system substrate-binding protein
VTVFRITRQVLTPCFALTLALVFFLQTPALAETPRVVVSIKSLHSIVSKLMVGVGEPELLIKSMASPHDARLRPSQVRALGKADLIVWIGGPMEAFMLAVMENRKSSKGVIEVLKLPELTRHPARVSGVRHEEPDDHDHGDVDPHVWLSTNNAIVIATSVARELSRLDPDHAAIYDNNLIRSLNNLARLAEEIKDTLRPYVEQRFVAIHDAFQYFERQFGLQSLGALSPTAGTSPGARRIHDLRNLIKQENIRCITSDPFEASAYLQTLVDGSGARIAALDPDGMAFPAGPDQYAKMMKHNASALASCLGLR